MNRPGLAVGFRRNLEARRLQFRELDADNGLRMAKVRTSLIAPGISGTLGNAVFVQGPVGTIVRSRPERRRAVSPAQSQARQRMTRVAAIYRSLTSAEAEAWRTYARSLNPNEAESASLSGPSGQQIFNAYGLKILQIAPGAEIPRLPPTEPFFGDSVPVSVHEEPGGAAFVPMGSNRPGIVTELLVQRLPSPQCRTYLERYRTARFAELADAPVFVPLASGSWALAVRFVESATGRMMPVIELGVVDVAG